MPVCGDSDDQAELDLGAVQAFAQQYGAGPVLVYGATTALWTHVVGPLQKAGRRFHLPHARVLHSGGWKRLEAERVDKGAFNTAVADVFGCRPEAVIDFYGMTEAVGIVFPDCAAGSKHAPAAARFLIRDPVSMAVCPPGRPGLIQIFSCLPPQLPGP